MPLNTHRHLGVTVSAVRPLLALAASLGILLTVAAPARAEPTPPEPSAPVSSESSEPVSPSPVDPPPTLPPDLPLVTGVFIRLDDKCLSQSVSVSNERPAGFDVAVYLNGDLWSSGTIGAGSPANPALIVLTGPPMPKEGLTIDVVKVTEPMGWIGGFDPDSANLEHCGWLIFTYLDECTLVTATVNNVGPHPSSVQFFTFSGTRKPVSPVVDVPVGATVSTTIPIRDEAPAWVDIAAYVLQGDEDVDIFTIKGVDGDCALAATGTTFPTAWVAMGATLIVAGTIAVLLANRRQSARV
jgi:hypothetical protein